jgi:acetolactate synthase-1/2/3 large subunit
MIKVSDLVVKKLVEYGVSDVFMISGGGAMHLNDSIGKCKEINFICNHHEQAAAMAAEGYSRASGKLSVVIVTSGPGGTNTLTGVMGQWTDSVPVLYISGQVKQETTIESCRSLGLRQLGDQEVNIVDIVRNLTKYADIITSPAEVSMKLDKAIHIATTGRKGPVWLDIPLDVQGAWITEVTQEQCLQEGAEVVENDITGVISRVVDLLKVAERPVLIAGHGIRLSGSQNLFLEMVDSLGVPVVTTFNGFDIIHSEHELYVGRIGTLGTRAGNFALQNSDLIISLGSRNNIRQVSYNWESFARAAKKVFVDIDKAELNKPTVKPDIGIAADVGSFLAELQNQLTDIQLPDWNWWQTWTQERKKKYPTVLGEYKTIKDKVHPYVFVEELTDIMRSDTLMVAGNGTACVSLFQAGKVKKGQRAFWNSGCASMGYDLPAAIGASFANKNREIVCLTGEGSIQMNLQEIQTMVYHRLPIKLFILNNNGYCSIRQTQTNYFDGRYVACDDSSGLSFPDMQKLSTAFGIHYETVSSHLSMRENIHRILSIKGPVICDVMLTLDYTFSPKLSSERKSDGRMISKPLEDMYPFLEREEFKSNMLIPMLD